jgi:regulatory protein
MCDADERLQRAIELASRYLSHRDRTEAEVRRQLQAKGLDGLTVDSTIDTLTESRYLDDARFARLFAQDKRELEYWGSDRIMRALLARGVDRELIAETLGVESSSSELDRAVALLRRRFPAPPEHRREQQRALGVLVRKGFDSELAREALAAYRRLAREPRPR